MEKREYRDNDGNVFVKDKLLPCPFCGFKPPELFFIGNNSTKSRSVEVKCPGCSIKRTISGIRSDHEQVLIWSIEMWNQRKEAKGEEV